MATHLLRLLCPPTHPHPHTTPHPSTYTTHAPTPPPPPHPTTYGEGNCCACLPVSSSETLRATLFFSATLRTRSTIVAGGAVCHAVPPHVVRSPARLHFRSVTHSSSLYEISVHIIARGGGTAGFC